MSKRNPTGDGYWISPRGDAIAINEHARYISEHPQQFGFHPDDPKIRKYWEHREELLTTAVKRGWIRVRMLPRALDMVNFYKMSPKTAENIWSFYSSLPVAYMDKQTVFLELATDQRWQQSPRELLKVEANGKKGKMKHSRLSPRLKRSIDRSKSKLVLYKKRMKRNPGLEASDNQWRFRVKSPGMFQKKTFRTKPLSAGVSIIVGRLKAPALRAYSAEASYAGRSRGRSASSTQSYRFDKSRFSKKQAKDWLKKYSVKRRNPKNPGPGSFEYKRVSIRSAEGMKQAERLKDEGWKILPSGSSLIADILMFERPKIKKPVERKNPVNPSVKNLSSDAVRTFHKIHGTDPSRVEQVNDGMNRELIMLGEVTHIEYKIPFPTTRDKGRTIWRHRFIVKPKLCLTKDGKPVILWARNHHINDRGLIG